MKQGNYGSRSSKQYSPDQVRSQRAVHLCSLLSFNLTIGISDGMAPFNSSLLKAPATNNYGSNNYVNPVYGNTGYGTNSYGHHQNDFTLWDVLTHPAIPLTISSLSVAITIMRIKLEQRLRHPVRPRHYKNAATKELFDMVEEKPALFSAVFGIFLRQGQTDEARDLLDDAKENKREDKDVLEMFERDYAKAVKDKPPAATTTAHELDEGEHETRLRRKHEEKRDVDEPLHMHLTIR